MSTINLTADLLEVNRYDFTVEVDDNLSTEEAHEVAKSKLKNYLENNCPNIFQYAPEDGIMCVDREAAYSTESVNSIDIK